MSETKPRRGRPKGSGIDDRGRLREIAHIIAANPHMRPTTAIKALGILNPSTIRRLRDKYKLAQALGPAAMTAPDRHEPGARRTGNGRPAAAFASRSITSH